MKALKLNSVLIYVFLVLMSAGCNLQGPPCEKDPVGYINGSVNGVKWENYKPKDKYSTLVRFDNKLSKELDCVDENFTTITFSPFRVKRYIDFYFHINLNLNGKSEFNKFQDFNGLSDLCKEIPILGLKFYSSGITSVEYVLDESHNNYFKISSQTKNKIDGSFDLRFIQDVKFSSTIHPDTLHFIGSEYSAIKCIPCDSGFDAF